MRKSEYTSYFIYFLYAKIYNTNNYKMSTNQSNFAYKMLIERIRQFDFPKHLIFTKKKHRIKMKVHPLAVQKVTPHVAHKISFNNSKFRVPMMYRNEGYVFP